jgi:hypothetical protein
MTNMKKVFVAIGAIIIVFSIATIFLSGVGKVKNPEGVDNFEKAKIEFQSGNYSIIFDIPKSYYTNPEFYPNYNPGERNSTRKAIYGYGAYPSDVTYGTDNVSINQSIYIYALIFASTGVYSYQGIGLSVSSPNDELFETRIDPADILLSPKYFGNSSNVTSDWAYKLKMTIIAKKYIPKGEYIFRLKAGNPSPEKDLEYNKVSDTYISGSPIQPSKLFDFVLKVNK